MFQHDLTRILLILALPCLIVHCGTIHNGTIDTHQLQEDGFLLANPQRGSDMTEYEGSGIENEHILLVDPDGSGADEEDTALVDVIENEGSGDKDAGIPLVQPPHDNHVNEDGSGADEEDTALVDVIENEGSGDKDAGIPLVQPPHDSHVNEEVSGDDEDDITLVDSEVTENGRSGAKDTQNITKADDDLTTGDTISSGSISREVLDRTLVEGGPNEASIHSSTAAIIIITALVVLLVAAAGIIVNTRIKIKRMRSERKESTLPKDDSDQFPMMMTYLSETRMEEQY